MSHLLDILLFQKRNCDLPFLLIDFFYLEELDFVLLKRHLKNDDNDDDNNDNDVLMFQ